MKPSRDADALAAKLTAAANAPLPLPNVTLKPAEDAASEDAAEEAVPSASAPEPEETEAPGRTRKKKPKSKEKYDVVALTLRADRELYDHYVLASAERTRRERKPVSLQQIMLEILADGVKRLK
jgi:hypothetical protein